MTAVEQHYYWLILTSHCYKCSYYLCIWLQMVNGATHTFSFCQGWFPACDARVVYSLLTQSVLKQMNGFASSPNITISPVKPSCCNHLRYGSVFISPEHTAPELLGPRLLMSPDKDAVWEQTSRYRQMERRKPHPWSKKNTRHHLRYQDIVLFQIKPELHTAFQPTWSKRLRLFFRLLLNFRNQCWL